MNNLNGNVDLFKATASVYFQRWAVKDLREYGRRVGLQTPTALKKDTLINTIIQTMCGELPPARTNLGKPAKPHYLDPDLLIEIELLKKECGLEYHPTSTNNELNPRQAAKKSTTETENQAPPVQIVIHFSELSKEQKEKLNEFLNCL